MPFRKGNNPSPNKKPQHGGFLFGWCHAGQWRCVISPWGRKIATALWRWGSSCPPLGAAGQGGWRLPLWVEGLVGHLVRWRQGYLPGRHLLHRACALQAVVLFVACLAVYRAAVPGGLVRWPLLGRRQVAGPGDRGEPLRGERVVWAVLLGVASGLHWLFPMHRQSRQGFQGPRVRLH